MADRSDFAVESYGGGFMVSDYSGERGKFGSAHCGKSGEWKDQPIIDDPFDSEAEAQEAVDKLVAA